jgi:hypothetical protein
VSAERIIRDGVTGKRWRDTGNGYREIDEADDRSGSNGIAADEGTETSARQVWRPIPPWPALEPTALHGLAGEIVETLDPHTEADPAAVLMDTLVSFGNAAGADARAEAEGAEHPARLWTVTVGETATARKGSSRRQVERVFERADPRWVKERKVLGLASGEGLIGELRETPNDPRRLVIEEEFSRVLRTAERQGSTLTPMLRAAWDHRGELGNRTKGESLRVERSHVSVIGHITVEELRRRLTETDTANGFANRFMYTLARRSKLLPDGGSLGEDELERLGARVRDALERARSIRRRVRRTPDAAERWREIYAEIAANERGGLAGAATARAEAHTLRLSVCYALLEGSSEIDLEHLEAAWAVWRYCDASAVLIFGDSLGDPDLDRLLDAIRDAGEDGLDLTRQRDVFGRHRSADALERMRLELEDRGLIGTRTIETGGRPRTVSVASQRAFRAYSAFRAPTGSKNGSLERYPFRAYRASITPVADSPGRAKSDRSAKSLDGATGEAREVTLEDPSYLEAVDRNAPEREEDEPEPAVVAVDLGEPPARDEPVPDIDDADAPPDDSGSYAGITREEEYA